MARIDGEIVIGRPVETVFDFVADERNEPTYNPQMLHAEKVTPGPVGTGTLWAATMASRRRLRDMKVEVTEYERPSRLGTRSTLQDAEVSGGLTFEPIAGGTRMRWSWEVRPFGLLRLLSPVVRLVGRRQEARTWAALKRELEHDHR